MKLEFLEDLTNRGQFKNIYPEKLIRLWDFGPIEAKKFQDLIKGQILNQNRNIDLKTIPFIENLNCSLTLIIAGENSGVHKLEGNRFEFKMNKKAYINILNLIEPFVREDIGGYQWLDELAVEESSIDFLFSPSGSW